MKEITFTQKSCNEIFKMSQTNCSFKINKPMLCPVCGAYQDGINRQRTLFAESKYGAVCYECSHCHKRYIVVYNVDLDTGTGTFGTLYPTAYVTYENEVLSEVSPRFISTYNQALRAESTGDIELAAIGFRQSLECLVKDYAVSVLHENRTEVVKKTLFEAIDKYLDSASLIRTADVVRILGNDYAHYERKYPEHDFELLKKYMQIFINLIETQVMIANPPVSR